MDGSFGNMNIPFSIKEMCGLWCRFQGKTSKETRRQEDAKHKQHPKYPLPRRVYLKVKDRWLVDAKKGGQKRTYRNHAGTVPCLLLNYWLYIWMAKNSEGWNHLKYRTSIWNCISWPFHVRNLLLTAPKSLPLMPGRGHLQVASIGVKVSPTKYPFLIFSGSFFWVPN